MNEFVWKLEVEYPEGPNYAPPNWEPDDEYIDRFGTDQFWWPTVRRCYLSRSAAVNRANLLESYGARVRLFRSQPLTFEERNFQHTYPPLRSLPGGAA